MRDLLDSGEKLLFWTALAALAYQVLGYPLVLLLTRCLRGRRRVRTGSDTPTLTVVIPARNAEAVIRQKIENTLGLEYPAGRLQVFVVDDGSEDRTGELVRQYSNRGVVLLRIRKRTGRSGSLKRAMESARGEIILFSDPRVFYRSDLLLRLVRNFSDPEVAGVSGRLRPAAKSARAAGPLDFARGWEHFLRTQETALGSMVGAEPSVLAFRRSLFDLIAPAT